MVQSSKRYVFKISRLTHYFRIKLGATRPRSSMPFNLFQTPETNINTVIMLHFHHASMSFDARTARVSFPNAFSYTRVKRRADATN